MPLYNSKQKVKSAMPLGGIGAGKLELTPYGTIDYITYQNNWTSPIENASNKKAGKAQGLAGFHFALYVNTQAAVICKLLQTEKISDYKTIKGIKYNARFPFVRLEYVENSLPVEISQIAYSHFVPADNKNSSLPGAVFEFEIKNKLKKDIDIGLMFMGRNLSSKNSVGRINKLRQDFGLLGLEMPGIYKWYISAFSRF